MNIQLSNDVSIEDVQLIDDWGFKNVHNSFCVFVSIRPSMAGVVNVRTAIQNLGHQRVHGPRKSTHYNGG